MLNNKMVDEQQNPQVKQDEVIDPKRLLESYRYYSNPVLVGIDLHDGIRLILQKLVSIEQRIGNIEERINGNIK
jgi:hypothetical protein